MLLLFLYFTKLLTKKLFRQAIVLEWMAGDNRDGENNRVSNFPVWGRLGAASLFCYTNVECNSGVWKPYLVAVYYVNGVGYSGNSLKISWLCSDIE